MKFSLISRSVFLSLMARAESNIGETRRVCDDVRPAGPRPDSPLL